LKFAVCDAEEKACGTMANRTHCIVKRQVMEEFLPPDVNGDAVAIIVAQVMPLATQGVSDAPL
jgi:xanthine/uracil permease